MQVDHVEIVEHPINFDMLDIDPRHHGQEMHNFIRHVVDVRIDVILHEIDCAILKRIQILILLAVLANPSNRYQNLFLSSVEQVCIGLRGQERIARSEIGELLLFLLDIRLHENYVRTDFC